jgi:hypothetical protein
MGDIVLAGATSGTTTLTPTAVSGTTTLTLPATTGTVVTKDTNGILSVNGVQFPATQSASADANCLDDYEEGTYTPNVTATSGGVSVTFTSSGTYIKIGRQVHVHGQVNISALASAGSGALILGNLPFSANASYFGSCIFSSVDIPVNTVQITVYANGTNCLFINNFDNAGVTDGLTTYLTGSSAFYYDITYFV